MIEYLAENARLRQLARRYADGQIPLDEYRAARREIIEALEAGRMQVATPAPLVAERDTPPAGSPRAAVSGADATMLLKALPAEGAGGDAVGVATLPPTAAGWDNPTRILAVVLGLSLLLALGALFYVFAL